MEVKVLYILIYKKVSKVYFYAVYYHNYFLPLFLQSKFKRSCYKKLSYISIYLIKIKYIDFVEIFRNFGPYSNLNMVVRSRFLFQYKDHLNVNMRSNSCMHSENAAPFDTTLIYNSYSRIYLSSPYIEPITRAQFFFTASSSAESTSVLNENGREGSFPEILALCRDQQTRNLH